MQEVLFNVVFFLLRKNVQAIRESIVSKRIRFVWPSLIRKARFEHEETICNVEVDRVKSICDELC